MSLYIDMQMILPLKFSDSNCKSVIGLGIFSIPMNIFARRRHSVDSIHIFEVIVFRIPFNFALPGRHRIISLFSTKSTESEKT